MPRSRRPLSRRTAHVRVMVYPNITLLSALEADSYCHYLNVCLRQLNRLRNDLFFYLVLPQPVELLADIPNTEVLTLPVPGYPPMMRVHTDTAAIKALFAKTRDVDVVWTHQPEHTHALRVVADTTTHRPRWLGYAHWFDVEEVCSWRGSFCENISGILEMDKCGINTNSQAVLVGENASRWFAPSVVKQIEQRLYVMPPPVATADVADGIARHTEKTIVWNHRIDESKSWSHFLSLMRRLRSSRKDFRVWAPQMKGASPERWIDTTKHDKKDYLEALRRCRLGVGMPQPYRGWSIAITDCLMKGVPVVLWDEDYYRELYDDALCATTDDEMLAHINTLLDTPRIRNRAANAALAFAKTTLATDRTMRVFSSWIDEALDAMPKTHTARTQQLARLIQKRGRMTKQELVAETKWGSFAFTPYRRALLERGIVDVGDGTPTYEWRGRTGVK